MAGDFNYLPTTLLMKAELTKLTSSRGNEEGCIG